MGNKKNVMHSKKFKIFLQQVTKSFIQKSIYM